MLSAGRVTPVTSRGRKSAGSMKVNNKDLELYRATKSEIAKEVRIE